MPSEKKRAHTKEQLIADLSMMVLIRLFEEKCAQLYGIRKIGGFCHLYIGQEAVAVGSIALLDHKKDYILTSYRDHAHALAVGMDPGAIMAELMGKASGCSKGKGGSMHLFDVPKGFYGGNGIVGSQIPVSVGVAFRQRYFKEDGVTLCYFGDGAVQQGTFHESMNLAKIWKLPVIFIVENNQYGMGTATSRIAGNEKFETMAQAYNLKGHVVDGMNYFDVYDKVSMVVERARKYSEASLLHVKTYRYRGHSMSDPAKYRSREEVDSFKDRDPIFSLRSFLIEEKMMTKKDYENIEKEQAERVTQAVAFAENSPEPSAEALYEDVFVN